jgi:ribonuclease BN (tRNA processing enzyme)
MSTISKALDFDLMSVELSLAKDARALIIERVPPSELILDTQNRQSILRRKMDVHCSAKIACSIAEDAQSGHWMIVWSGKVLWRQARLALS